MNGNRMRQRGGIALLMAIGFVGLADAQIQISADPNVKQDPKGFLANLTVRPGAVQDFYIFVKNPTGNAATLTVQLRDGQGRAILAQGKGEFKADETRRVKLEKVAPPPPPKDAVVAKEPVAKPVVPAPEPPPGVELKRGGKRFEFQLWLLSGEQVLENEKRTIAVSMAQPGSPAFPIATPQAKTATVGNKHDIAIPITANASLRGAPAIVELVIPPQDSLNVNLRPGFYRRQIDRDQKNVSLQADNLPFKNDANKTVNFHVNVDGLPRAFVYQTDFRANPAGTPDARTEPGIAVMPVAADRYVVTPFTDGGTLLKPRYGLKPAEKTPVRIEVDNPPANATVQLRLAYNDKGDFASADTIDIPGGARDERVYLDFEGDNDPLQIRFIAADRVYQLDTRSLRGTFGLQAVLRDDAGKELARDYCLLALDDTPPESVVFVDLPSQHVKGTLLTLKAKAVESETSVTQAIFFVGEAVDGKLPDIKAKGGYDAKNGVWVARLPVPDKSGMVLVGVQFINETGLQTSEPKQIELVDPPSTGWITGVVELGGRGQPGVTVTLVDGEGKVKGTAVTEDEKDNKPDTPAAQKKVNGRYRIEKVPAGAYRVQAAKPDSGVGTKGGVTVQVQVGAESKANVRLERKP